MTQVTIHEAKTHLSRLIQAVEEGEEITIARAGRPVARLVPTEQRRERRKPGWAKGKIKILEGFDEYDEQIARDFGMIDDEE
jgi:prevent-host-death family protein